MLNFEAVSERSLTWSEEMRKSIEAQIATAPKVEETLLTLRCTVEKGRTRMWVNGRFVFEIPLEADMDPAGVVKIQLSAGAELASVLAANPFPQAAPNRTVAIFLDKAPPADTLKTVKGSNGEEIALGKREIYVHYGDGMADSKLKIPAAKVGTARNINTIGKLIEMAGE